MSRAKTETWIDSVLSLVIEIVPKANSGVPCEKECILVSISEKCLERVAEQRLL